MKKFLLVPLLLFVYESSYSATLSFELGDTTGGLPCSTGSCFGIGDSDFNGYVNISSHDGLIVDGVTTQSASGSHAGPPDGSESPGIDNPWEWVGQTGMFFTTSPVIKVGGSENTVMLDMSGLSITWNGEIIQRVEDEFGLPGNAATITCASTCSDGESYSLTLEMALPGECYRAGCFGQQYRYYDFILRGTISGSDISNVPVPGAIWLFVAGLLGLAGFVRRKTA